MNTSTSRLGLVPHAAGPRFAARLWTTAPLALAAAVVNQVLHEGTHVVVALAVGDVARVQLFAVDTIAEGRTAQLLVAGSAAIVNIVVAAVAFLLARRMTSPIPRLGMVIFAGFSAATGFGYLMFDAIFASPDNQVGDWKVVVQLLGGGAAVRIPLFVIGAAGWVGTMFLLARGSLWFASTPPGPDGAVRPNRAERVRTAVAVLLVPYLTTCVFLTVLVVPSHPLGAAGVVASLLHYWLGYSLFLWAFGLAGVWLTVDTVGPPVTPLPPSNWRVLAVGGAAIVVALALTSVWPL
jgi:hypothetical protein